MHGSANDKNRGADVCKPAHDEPKEAYICVFHSRPKSTYAHGPTPASMISYIENSQGRHMWSN